MHILILAIIAFCVIGPAVALGFGRGVRSTGPHQEAQDDAQMKWLAERRLTADARKRTF